MKDNIINFSKDNAVEGITLEIERSEEFYKKAKELSDFVQSLPLSSSDNQKLIELMVNQTLAAEKSGFDFGVKLSKDMLNAVKGEKA